MMENIFGMRDPREEFWVALEDIKYAFAKLFSMRGYQFVETPLIEQTELFNRKGGGELISQMYSFLDPDGKAVSLRPEFTSSIVKWCVDNIDDLQLPLRLQYAGPVFRHGAINRASPQFHQFGLELLGSDHPKADSEILSLACAGLSNIDHQAVQLVLGDIGVYHQLLNSFKLSQREQAFVLRNISNLRNGSEGFNKTINNAKEFGFLQEDNYIGDNLEGLDKIDPQYLVALLSELSKEYRSDALGQRSPEEVAAGLLRKSMRGSDSGKLEQALTVTAELAVIRGKPEEALNEAYELFRQRGMKSFALDGISDIIGWLRHADTGNNSLIIDFGLIRDISYYTGIVFEILDEKSGVSLAGGGRYDGLAMVLGSKVMIPALGFAYDLDAICKVLEGDKNAPQKENNLPVLIITKSLEMQAATESLINRLILEGKVVELEVMDRSVSDSLIYARNRGFNMVIEVVENGELKRHDLK